jgi:uncharacterized membrane protein
MVSVQLVIMPTDLTTFGFILIILGIVLIAASSLSGSGKTEGKVAVVGFIGPIPIGFGNDQRLVQIAIIIGIVIFVLLLLIGRGIL